MKKIIALCLFVAAVAFAVGPADVYGKLQAKNGMLYSANTNQPVQLKGMSMFWDVWSSEFYTASVIKGLVDKWKIEIIRVPHGVGGEKGGGPMANWQNVDETVIQAAIDNGIYVIIDFHSHVAHTQTNDAKTFFKTMASKWGKYPNVIFEIYNEPMGAGMWSTIKTYADQVIPAIRQNGGTDNLIIVGNSEYSIRPGEAVSNPIKDSNVAYTFHFYAGSHSLDGGAYSGNPSYRTGINNAIQAGLTVFVTEWGTVNASGNGGYNKSSSDAWMNFLDQKKISWCNWSVHSKDESASIFANQSSYTNPQNWNYSGYSESGKYVYDHLQSWANSAPWRSGAVTPASSSSSVGGVVSGGKTNMFDDFEDLNKYAFTGGVWYAYTDKDDKGLSSISNKVVVDDDGEGWTVVVPTDNSNSTKGMLAATGIKLVKGENEYAPYIALGINLNKDESAFDLTSCKTFSYKYKGAAHNFKVQSTKVENYNYHSTSFIDQGDWKTVTIDWADLVQGNWGAAEAATHFDISKFKNTVNKLAWEVKGDEKAATTTLKYDYLYIDDVMCDGMSINIVTPSSSSSTPKSSSSSVKSSSSSAKSSSSSVASSSSVKSSSSSVKPQSSSSQPEQTCAGQCYDKYSGKCVAYYANITATDGSTYAYDNTCKLNIYYNVGTGFFDKPMSSSSSKPTSSSAVNPSSSSSAKPQDIGIVANRVQLGTQLNGRTLQLFGANLMNVTVFDMQGRPMMNLRNIQGEISLENLPTGNYVVRVSAGSANMTKRFTLK